MAAQGLESLVPLADLAVAGVTEVLPRAPLILRRVRQTVAAIQALKPDAVVTIDSSGFSWRIAQRLRRRGERLPLIHYVAPMVWAWRGGRARRMARWYDHLLTLPAVRAGLFQGRRPRRQLCRPSGARERRRRGQPGAISRGAWDRPRRTADQRAAGSRGGEVRRLLPIFGHALLRLERMVGPFRIAVPTVATVADLVSQGVRLWPGRPIVLRGHARQIRCLRGQPRRACRLGDGGARIGNCPSTDGDRLSPQSADRSLARTVSSRCAKVNLINLLLDRPLVPEHLGRAACAPERLAATLAELIGDERVRSAHREGYDEAIARLRGDGLSPSRAAADRTLAVLAAHRGDPPGDCPKVDPGNIPCRNAKE